MLEEKILNDYKEAMKARDTLKSSALNFLRAELMNVAIAEVISGGNMPELKGYDIETLIKTRAMGIARIRDMRFKKQASKYKEIEAEIRLGGYRIRDGGIIGRAYFEFQDRICFGDLSFVIRM